jgi:hypothetical protein
MANFECSLKNCAIIFLNSFEIDTFHLPSLMTRTLSVIYLKSLVFLCLVINLIEILDLFMIDPMIPAVLLSLVLTNEVEKTLKSAKQI